jgi:branched-chain amino acid transport system substrate-binding protein
MIAEPGVRPRKNRRHAALAAALAIAATGCHGAENAYWVAAVGQFEGREAARENLRGILLATSQVNAAGGINGRPVRLVINTDDGRGDLAARLAHKFVADRRISVVVGHTTSAAMMAAAPVYDGHLAAIATTASAPALTGISRWVFRVMLSDSVTGAQLGRFSAARGWRSAAILYQNDVYGRGLADAFQASFPGKIVSSDAVPADIDDLSLFTRFYERFTPDVVFVVVGRSAVPVRLHEAFAARGIHVAILASEGSTDFERNASGAEEIYVSAPFISSSTDPATVRFTGEFTARFGHPPKHDAALAYDAAMTAFAAIRAVGGDRDDIRRYLSSIDSSHALSGATGAVSFDAFGDRRSAHGVLLQVRAGHVVLLPDALR